MSLTSEEAEKMKVEELKSALSSRQLSTTGKKSDLLSRLLASIEDESSASGQEEGTAMKKQKVVETTEVEVTPVVEPVVSAPAVPVPVPSVVQQDPVQVSTNTSSSSSSNSQSTSTAWNLASADASLPAVRGRATVQLRATSGFSATAAALATNGTNASTSIHASSGMSTTAADAISPSGATKNNDERLRVKCPYLDTINRHIIDTDMEKVCSVTLSNLHVYVCLVCGKYFQGRGKATPAYTHSVQCGHFVFMNLHDGRAFCLPDGYEV